MPTFTKEEISDIQASYREAKDPEKQVGILSELYACSTNDIVLALQPIAQFTAPLSVSAVSAVGKAKRKSHSEAFKRAVAQEAQQPNANLSAIARIHGVTGTTVKNWLLKYPMPTVAPPEPLPTTADPVYIDECIGIGLEHGLRTVNEEILVAADTISGQVMQRLEAGTVSLLSEITAVQRAYVQAKAQLERLVAPSVEQQASGDAYLLRVQGFIEGIAYMAGNQEGGSHYGKQNY